MDLKSVHNQDYHNAMFDLVIKNGTVIDGSGFGRVEADVAIEGGKKH